MLLDMHIGLWAVADDPKRPARARELITEPTNDVFVSVANLWEIAIEHALKPRWGGALSCPHALRANHPLKYPRRDLPSAGLSPSR